MYETTLVEQTKNFFNSKLRSTKLWDDGKASRGIKPRTFYAVFRIRSRMDPHLTGSHGSGSSYEIYKKTNIEINLIFWLPFFTYLGM